jgi:YD repeat-containing protein
MTAIRKILRYSQPLRPFLLGEQSQAEEPETLSLVLEFDSAGKLLIETRHDQHGEAEEIHRFTYNDAGHAVNHEMELPQEGIFERFATERNADGLPLNIQKFYGDDPGERTEMKYAEHGNPVHLYRTDADGEFEEEETREYDEQSRIIIRTLRNASGESTITRIEYDDQGLPKTETETDADGQITAVTTIVYDTEGREVKITRANAGGKVISVQESEYDELGRLRSRTSRGFYVRISLYTYDEAGRLVEESLSDENGFVISRKQSSYSENGQLVEEVVYETDLTRAGRDTHIRHRFEQELFD